MSRATVYIISICICIALFAIIELIMMLKKSNESWAFSADVARVNGVSINNSMTNVLKSGLESGMVIPQVQQLLSLTNNDTNVVGKTGFEIEDAAIKNTLELSPTLSDFRYQVAAANTHYIPPTGLPNVALWYQRNTLQNLFQPGLVPALPSSSSTTSSTSSSTSTLNPTPTPSDGKPLGCACK